MMFLNGGRRGCVRMVVGLRVRIMLSNATFNNISAAISWRSVLLVEETGVPGDVFTGQLQVTLNLK
jgi:hypothetical protein